MQPDYLPRFCPAVVILCTIHLLWARQADTPGNVIQMQMTQIWSALIVDHSFVHIRGCASIVREWREGFRFFAYIWGILIPTLCNLCNIYRKEWGLQLIFTAEVIYRGYRPTYCKSISHILDHLAMLQLQNRCTIFKCIKTPELTEVVIGVGIIVQGYI